MEQKFIESFRNALEMEDGINLNDDFRKYEEWDSLAYLEVIAMLDEEFEVEIEAEDFKKLITIEELLKEVKTRTRK